ncbi:MAG: acyltransferase [Ruminococcus sp.]|nr:acyltransferase [Ruminococcus sp.]MCM1380706.1 acyltransferase [Muribaculaceae bacterium]
MNTQEKRLEYIDVAKAIAIFLVVLGHPRAVEDYGAEERFLYAFHMPLFFMMSGIFLKQKSEYGAKTWKLFFKKNLLGLFVPYIIWAAIYMPFSYINVGKTLYGSWIVLRNTHSLSSLWFLPVMFMARTYQETMMHLSWRLKTNPRIFAAASAAVFFAAGIIIPHNNRGDGIGMPWGFDIAFMASVFMITGYLLRPVLDGLFERGIPAKLGIAAVCLGLLLVGIRFADYSEEYPFMLMANADFGNPFICLLNGVTGSLGVIMLAQIISRALKRKRLIIFIGQNTMGIYLIHKNFLQGLYNMTLNIAAGIPYLVRALAVTCISIAFSVFLMGLLSKYISEILGRPSEHRSHEEELMEA